MTIKKIVIGLLMTALVTAVIFSAGCVNDVNNGGNHDGTITITDAGGRTVSVPDNPKRVALCGAGFMRYFVYLHATENIVAVDFSDSKAKLKGQTKPYIIAHPELLGLPSVGSAMDTVDPELLMSSKPDILFLCAYSGESGQIADEITQKTGIPVVLVAPGDYVTQHDKITDTLRMIGTILHKQDRAEEIIKYFDDTLMDLEKRTAKVPDSQRPKNIYICGISSYGAHGAEATDVYCLPFDALKAGNAAEGEKALSTSGYAVISKEKILEWDPDKIFVDLSTLRAAGGGALVELGTDPSYVQLSAVKNGEIYTVNPDTSAGVNHETSLSNAYYIGKILYPEQFADIDPEAKADEIYTFVVGAPIFEQLKENMNGLSYKKVDVLSM